MRSSQYGLCWGWFRSLLSLTVGLLLLTSGSLATSKKNSIKDLPPSYREWLTRDVAYIATRDEKSAFLNLSTDAERDKFIEEFWEVRNPNPGSPTNTYKEEIYRRIAYANEWFGHNSGVEGWRTDRGQVYITLGPPKQDAKYLGFASIRPMEIWFYEGDHPALPPYFYVVFYQKNVGAGFTLYSPYMDGPEKLVSGPTELNRVASWRQIDRDAGREVSRTVLSLIPSEPVDMQTATSSLASDMLLNNIRGLANLPLNKEMLQQRRNALTAVSHRVVLGSEYLDVITVPLVAESGETNLHYVLRLKRPSDFSLAEDKDGRRYYSAAVSARVLTPEGKLIFSQQRKLSQYVDDKQLVIVKNRVFGYEGLLPLPPGQYKVEFQLGDELQHTSYRAERTVVVPARPDDGLRITEVVPFSEVTSGEASYLPFSAGGVRFTPATEGLTLVPGQDLEFFYQLWAPASEAGASPDSKLQVEYAYGRMGLHDTQTLQQEVPRNQFDANGSLINGKKIPTATLAPGGYRMAVTVTDPETRNRSVASFQFRISDREASPPIWDIVDPQATEDVQKGTREYQRALCYASQGDQEREIAALQAAYRKNPDQQTLNRLVSLLYSRRAFAQVAQLYRQSGVTAQTDEQTILAIADSLSQLGEVGGSIQLLESQVAGRQSSALYLSLSRYYQVSGDNKKASEMEQKAKTIALQPTT